jgi:adenylosuccinate synthase
MPKQVVILSGHVGSGKTTLADKLVQQFGASLFKTFDFLTKRGSDIALERSALQAFGEKLDKRTGGAWVAEDVRAAIEALPDHEDLLVVIDSVRMQGQADAIRQTYGRRVFHVHLDATEQILATRYANRPVKAIKEMVSYAAVQRNRTERNVPKLEKTADVVIRTDRCTEKDVLIQVASHLGLYGREYLRLVDVLVGGQYGSEGKGQVAAYLSPEYDLLIRVGGPNAGHKVYEEPKPYAFHQLPSGTRACEAKILIGAGAVINVETIMREIGDCKVSKDRLSIDPQAMIISPEDKAHEGRLVRTIGSTGQGVGAATARRIMRGADVRLARDIRDLRPYIRPGREVLEEAFRDRKRILLEGTQGTGLSLYHGQYPKVTSRDTTVAGCLAEAGISPKRVQRVIMVCRTYPIRVQNAEEGDSGDMSQELEWEDVAERSGYSVEELKEAEKTTTTKRQRRVAEFDWDLLHKAATLNAPTDIALTFVDYLSRENTKARRMEQLTKETISFIEGVERVASAPVTLISTRFHTRSIIDRRMWG